MSAKANVTICSRNAPQTQVNEVSQVGSTGHSLIMTIYKAQEKISHIRHKRKQATIAGVRRKRRETFTKA